MEGKELKCTLCDSKFTRKYNLYAHKRSIHKIDLNLRRCSKVCAFCENKFWSHKELRDHLKKLHEVDIHQEIIHFITFKDFQSWKIQKEKEFNCIYRKQTGYTLNEGKKRTYYICHRSGDPQLIPEDQRKRKLKRQGSCKMGSTCSSTIEVKIFSSGSVEAIIYTPHTHVNTHANVYLTNEERKQIAGKLSKGVSFDAILDNIRDKVQGNVKYIQLINRRGLRNIKKTFGIHHHLQLHENDAVSVDLWVRNMRKLGKESPVLFYKPLGVDENHGIFAEDDIVIMLMTPFQGSSLSKFGSNIVCLDSTHGTNNYNFLLTTLIVVDKNGEGLPVAYLISNKIDINVLKHFFKVIRGKVGSIEAKVFMSGDNSSFYDAWINVMPKPLNHLLCTWHVDDNWRKHLQKVKAKPETKAKVYKCVRMLMEATDEGEFKSLLDNVIGDLLSCESMQDFGNYFIDHYVNRVHQWAYCFRRDLGRNINVYLESVHKMMKLIYMEGKTRKRLDKVIHVLMKFTRDILFDTYHKTIIGNTSCELKLININHNKSKAIDETQVIELNNKVWQVPSTDESLKYTVCKEIDNCELENCHLKCIHCKACIHLYSCNCPSYHITYTMCKHIHAVSSIESNTCEPNTTLQNDLLFSVSSHEEIISTTDRNTCESFTSFQNDVLFSESGHEEIVSTTECNTCDSNTSFQNDGFFNESSQEENKLIQYNMSIAATRTVKEKERLKQRLLKKWDIVRDYLAHDNLQEETLERIEKRMDDIIHFINSSVQRTVVIQHNYCKKQSLFE